MKNKSGMDFTEGPIFSKLAVFTIPLVLSSLLQQFYSTADQIIVGKFAGDTALAAVGATTFVINFILNLFIGLSVGATVTCAKFRGAKDAERTSQTVHTAMAFAFVCGLIVAFIGIVFARPIMTAMDTPDEVIDHAVLYMSIIFAGRPFSMVYNFGSGLLRADGDTKRPLWILMISGLINVILNLIFVIYCKMGVAGVALATVISEIISSLAVFFFMIRRNDDMKLSFRKIKFHKDEFINIVRIGVPSGINSCLYSVANIILQTNVNSFGKTYMAASTAATSLSNYVSLVQSSISTAVVSLVGQNYGAKKYKRIHKSARLALIMSFIGCAIVALLFCLMPRVFLRMFTDEKAVIDAGVSKVYIMCIGYLLNGHSAIYGAVLRGIEKPNIPMILNIIAIFGIRLIWLWFIFPLNPTFEMVFMLYPVSYLFASVMTTSAYYIERRKFPPDSV